MPLTLTSSFNALLDDGQASAELSALREKVAFFSFGRGRVVNAPSVACLKQCELCARGGSA